LAVQQAGYAPKEKNVPISIGADMNSQNLKKDVTKTFKRMLTQNNKRGTKLNNGSNLENDSTNYEGSNMNKQDLENFTQISEIENKFVKKKRGLQGIIGKYYKEDNLKGDALQE